MNIKDAKLCGCGEVHSEKVCPKCGATESIRMSVYFLPKDQRTEYFEKFYRIGAR